MDTPLNKAIILNLPNDSKNLELPPDELPNKPSLFWRKTLEAGQREEQLPAMQRFKKIIWDYNIGALKGWGKGVGHALKEFFDPRSDFNNPDYREIFQDIQNLPDTALDYGISYMDKNWEERGELNSQKGVEGGLWVLKCYLGAKDLTKGIFKGAKKLFL
jgi:hypothetical protein